MQHAGPAARSAIYERSCIPILMLPSDDSYADLLIYIGRSTWLTVYHWQLRALQSHRPLNTSGRQPCKFLDGCDGVFSSFEGNRSIVLIPINCLYPVLALDSRIRDAVF